MRVTVTKTITRRMVMKTGFLLLLTLFLAPCFAQPDIYVWTDSRGIRHFSNVSPPPENRQVLTFDEKSQDSLALSRITNRRELFRVVKVYDGDSIKVKDNTITLMVRLVGIDAPESGHGKRAGQPYSRESKRLLERFLAGKTVRIKSYGTGGYNRQLAEVFVNRKNINLEMVKNGMAEVYSGTPPESLDTASYRRAQAAAKRAGKGIWSLGRQYKSPKKWRKEHPR
ncbi:MAG TPA: thermonuclease family protein [Desulfobacteraceae bacterium]|nr:thermonuclease family protein [Desulfobacteraceae bacterium]